MSQANDGQRYTSQETRLGSLNPFEVLGLDPTADAPRYARREYTRTLLQRHLVVTSWHAAAPIAGPNVPTLNQALAANRLFEQEPLYVLRRRWAATTQMQWNPHAARDSVEAKLPPPTGKGTRLEPTAADADFGPYAIAELALMDEQRFLNERRSGNGPSIFDEWLRTGRCEAVVNDRRLPDGRIAVERSHILHLPNGTRMTVDVNNINAIAGGRQ